MNTREKIGLQIHCNVIKCEACEAEFVLYGVWRISRASGLAPQLDDGKMFCPYCGEHTIRKGPVLEVADSPVIKG